MTTWMGGPQGARRNRTKQLPESAFVPDAEFVGMAKWPFEPFHRRRLKGAMTRFTGSPG